MVSYLDRFRVTGRRAVVTGGGRGIGLACAEALAEAGAEVAIVDSDAANAEQALGALRAKGYTAQSLDVTDAPQVTAAADRLADTDILVCSAGIARSNTPAEDMLKAGRGAIVNVGSMSGFIVNRPQPQSYYNASKAAVHHLTKVAGRRMGAPRRARQRGRTDLYQYAARCFVYDDPAMHAAWIGGTPMQRMGEAEEIASVVRPSLA